MPRKWQHSPITIGERTIDAYKRGSWELIHEKGGFWWWDTIMETKGPFETAEEAMGYANERYGK